MGPPCGSEEKLKVAVLTVYVEVFGSAEADPQYFSEAEASRVSALIHNTLRATKGLERYQVGVRGATSSVYDKSTETHVVKKE